MATIAREAMELAQRGEHAELLLRSLKGRAESGDMNQTELLARVDEILALICG